MADAPLSLTDYWNMLSGHDWYYEFSDDHRVWSAGNAAHNRLLDLARQDPERQKLFDAFNNHYFSGAPWNTVQQPLPPRPAP